ncbi:hypothetical protein C1645_813983 [Glomus cerebriforme]|uniref:Uncharacterized protein n=1 Tax=Glomus cerebriforme TaxID=658196 RepID=A0A397TI11_9GLOM|nr:hypothetical protein C1645_813983 [Glomus cerebriforme]
MLPARFHQRGDNQPRKVYYQTCYPPIPVTNLTVEFLHFWQWIHIYYNSELCTGVTIAVFQLITQNLQTAELEYLTQLIAKLGIDQGESTNTLPQNGQKYFYSLFQNPQEQKKNSLAQEQEIIAQTYGASFNSSIEEQNHPNKRVKNQDDSSSSDNNTECNINNTRSMCY